ncbi:MAG TPA: CoA transferase, partial [Casimicrobiaceae bacterium]|nr:CoA transferase [Casimicrobiaceae bacterium]
SLMLAECGAEVIKVERPGQGDEMRRREPRLGSDSARFALLNRGKRSVALDLKLPSARTQLEPLLRSADVLIEQFRPGVMDRLGLGYASLREINPAMIYCSITGYGQHGDKAQVPGHDLNYLAEAGLLSLSTDGEGKPCIPAVPLGDVAGGSHVAVLNIVLALRQRERTGEGCHLDIAMARNLFAFMDGAWARGVASGDWSMPGSEWTGGSPRYRCYRTRDYRYLAVAALEPRFWRNFCAVLEISPEEATSSAIEIAIAQRSAAEWEEIFAGREACVSLVRSVEEAACEAIGDGSSLPRMHGSDGTSIPALPLPLAESLRTRRDAGYPALGADNALLQVAP